MKGLKLILAAALAGLTLVPAVFAASGDLGISDSSVSFSTDYYFEGTPIRIWASVSNNSENDLLGSVQVTANGTNVAADQPISALAGLTDDVFVDWTPSTFGYYDITITVVPWEGAEDDPSNNTVSKTIYVEQDTDHDGIPDASDDDLDGDGVNNDEDDFPSDSSETTDTDGDGTGDNEDTDDDNDGVSDEEDDFPEDPLHSSDQDGDGEPDETDEDLDGDGLSNEDEDKAGTDPENTDSDNDGVDDGSDPFPTDENEWSDVDGDGTGDNSDDDIDGDGVANEEDSHPSNSAPNTDDVQDVYLTDVGETIILDASGAEDPDGEIVEYVWVLASEDGTDTYYGEQVELSFEEKGTTDVTLTVVDDTGQSESMEVKIRVIDQRFLLSALLFTLALILLAFYVIYRYNRRALEKKRAKKPVKKASKKAKSKKKSTKKPKKK